MAYDGVDAETLALIIELQLSDAKRLIKGKGEETGTHDGELAADLYKCELESLARFNADRDECRRIAGDGQPNVDIVRQQTGLESRAARNTRQTVTQNQPATLQGQSAPGVDETRRRLEPERVADDDEGNEVGSSGESSSCVAERSELSIAPETHLQCIVCDEVLVPDQVIPCPCSHNYCLGCFECLMGTAINDEAFFPPRCCKQAIPIETTEAVLTSAIVEELRRKEVEYGTPNRVYCCAPNCSAFIAPKFIEGDTAICPTCSAQSCAICKGPSHENDCPEDEATREVLRIADENG